MLLNKKDMPTELGNEILLAYKFFLDVAMGVNPMNFLLHNVCHQSL
jgi:hypothetical protein